MAASPFAELPAPPPPSDYEASIIRDIERGLPSEQDRIAEAVRVLAYYNLEGASFVSRNEGDTDHIPVESTGLTKRVTDLLCSHSYSPPPSRTILDDERANELYGRVASDNKLNTILQRADVFAHLHGFSILEAVPAEGSKPVKLYLWDASQCIVRSEEEDATAIGYVIVRDLTPDGRIRYTMWSPTARRVFVGKNSGPHITSGGRATKLVEETINPYGRLPFACVHHQLPVSEMTTPGIGCWLADQELALDTQRYNLRLAVTKYALPKPWVSGVSPEWHPSNVVGEFMRIPAELMQQGTSTSTMGYLQSELDVHGIESHIDKSISRALEAMGIPESIYRMTQSSAMSGDAIEAEQRPLVTYTKNRQETLKQSESDLADAIFSVISAWFGNAEVYSSNRNITLSVEFPQDPIVIPGVSQDQQDAAAMELGIESIVGVTRRRYGLNSDEDAIRRLIKVKEDNDKLRALGILPALPAPERNDSQSEATPQSDLPIVEEEN